MLVDDHEMVRAGLRALLSQAGTLNIVGEASTAAEAVDLAIELRPDVVLMDLRLPDGSGVDACREILSAAPEVRVLFLTSYADEEAVIATLLAGAAGYVLKDIGYLALIRAIHDAADGRSILDAKLSESVLSRVQSAIQDARPVPGKAVDDLSPQERRILTLVVEGRTNKEIAAALGLSDKTVKNYLSNAFQKLHVTRRAHAAAVFAQPAAKP
jgi:RNA polymerase sigma factor (sigma-70 family)